MNRRGFFGRLFAGAALASPAIASATPADLPDVIVSGGIEARWLGWKRPVDMDRTWGAWIFTLPNGAMSYSTSGGVIYHNYREGCVMDMTHLDGVARWLRSMASEEELRVERTAAYERGLADAKSWVANPDPLPPDGFTYTYRVTYRG